MNTPKYTVKEIDSTIVLFVNNKPSECPFKTGLAGLDNFQRPTFINQHCNSQCPHFTLKRHETEKINILLSCASVQMSIEATGQQEPATPTMQIIKP